MLHRLGAVLTATLLLVVLVGPVAAVTDLTENGPDTLTGALMHVHGDTFDSRAEHHEWRLVKADGDSVELVLPGAEPSDGQVGKTVQVNGTMHGHRLVVRAGGMRPAAQPRATTGSPAAGGSGAPGTGTVAAATTAQALTTKRVGVLLINFTTNTGTPFTTQQVSDAFFGASPAASVATFYAEQSYGNWALSGDVLGYYTVNGNLSTCDWSTWGSLARTAATNAGVNLSQYTNIVHLFVGQGTCGWSGLAYVPGTYSFLNGTISTYVAAHELGHNFGVHHASTTSCTDNGVRVAISATCSANEYGDPYDVMGGSARMTSTWHRRQEGQLTTADQQTVTGSGAYSVGVAESSSPTAPRIVRVTRGDGSYLYLEYRQPAGVFDSFAANAPPVTGVSIRIAPDTAIVQSMLVDTTPATSTFTDAPLAVGQTVFDPIGSITLRTVSVSADAAVVEITVGGDTVPPSGVGNLAAAVLSPTSARLSWSAATDNVAATAYRLSRAGMSDVTVGASPWTDTAVPSGATATWTVTARDAAGNWGPSTDVSATMPPADTSPPTAVGSLAATVLSSTSARLSWTAAGDDFGVAGYLISRPGRSDATVSSGPWTDSALVAGNTYT
jgi:M6 family metalloprotease-like protein